MTEIKNKLNVIKLQTQKELEEVTRLHRETFSNNLTGSIGHGFIMFYFSRILASPNGIILICRDHKGLVGFVAGLSSKKGFQSLQYYAYGFFVALWQIIARPSIFKMILRHIKRMLAFRGKCLDAELMSIAVVGRARKLGIGRKLVEALEEFFKTRNVGEYEVFTDMEHGSGYAFYERLGFSRFLEIEMFGLKARLYRRKLK